MTDKPPRLKLSGWCSAAFGARPDQHHDGCRTADCACPGHRDFPALNKGARHVDPVASGGEMRDNKTSPQGAQTPAGSDHPSLPKNERG
jgi:hypothetical protein